MEKTTKRQSVSGIGKWLKRLFVLFFVLMLGVIASGYFFYLSFEDELPDVETLREVRYQIPLRVYSNDGKLIAQFGDKRRIPINIEGTPQQLIHAVLAAEDQRFFSHPGIDFQGLMRAGIELIRTGKKLQGASTITMQVIRNFFLSPEKTYTRKVKEIILSLQIENKLSKGEILELYLNKIFLGHRAYGFGAAADVYYGEPLSELSLAEIAMIAGLPKAPSRFNPITNPNRALERRNYVLGRMLDLGYILKEAYQLAISHPVTASLHKPTVEAESPYMAEMVRNSMFDRYGENVYTKGYKAYATIESRLQKTAIGALRETLHEYDERHGYRGPENSIADLSDEESWRGKLKKIPKIGDTFPGIVTSIAQKTIKVVLADSKTIDVPWEGLKWARQYISENSRGPKPKSARDILKPGDLIRLRIDENGKWKLAQVPRAEGAIVSLDPKNGAILALSGGFDFYQSKYNRATQAQRQPGSGFKPILYTTALEHGFTLASIINDAPVVFDTPGLDEDWRPKNYSGKFFGPTRLRVALMKSRNLVSIRLLQEIGIDPLIKSAKRFGFTRQQLPHTLSLALGSGSATPLQMARTFAVFANGGFLIEPYFTDRIESDEDEQFYQAEPITACVECTHASSAEADTDTAPRIISPQIHYLVNSMLKDVIRRGTGRKALSLERTDIAGKTGTTNEQRDAWFNGYSPTLVTISWVGFDNSKPLGARETGGQAALPMWLRYMKVALARIPEHPVTQPNGLVTVRIDSDTGLLASGENEKAITEIFRSENVPVQMAPDSVEESVEATESEKIEIESLF